MLKPRLIALGCLTAAVLVAYSNHFENPFHFDDSHAVVENPHIRSLQPVARFFTDASTSSSLPTNRVYRPLVPLSLALDYAIGGGLKPFYFQLSTFLWFLLQLALMGVLYRALAGEGEAGGWVALLAVALYGLHPAIAETVNYVVQRADVYSTLGAVASVALYARYPRAQRYGLYLLPLAAALLAKPPALVTPALLGLYEWLIRGSAPRRALRAALPALAVVVLLLVFIAAMTPHTFRPSTHSRLSYYLTQPVVSLGYFVAFFLPTHLTADSDRSPVASVLDGDAWVGFLFVAALVALALWCARRDEWKPAAFGLCWFGLALLPTALFPLSEVENDHRMYFPFVGLAFSVAYGAAKLSARLAWRTPARVAVCVVVLSACGYGTWRRNQVWHTDEGLWLDVTEKSPRNGRGLMNYGLTQMGKGDTARALDYFKRALAYNPNYYILEINLGIAEGELGHAAEAERHFQRAVALAPGEALGPFYYARWLHTQGRRVEALGLLSRAMAANPDMLPAAYLAMQIHSDLGQSTELQAVANVVLARFPEDATARGWLARAGPLAAPTPESLLNLSLEYHRAKRYRESIEAAEQALRLRPDYADAYNNIAAAHEELKEWDQAIAAARQALKINPAHERARGNLVWAESQKRAGAR